MELPPSVFRAGGLAEPKPQEVGFVSLRLGNKSGLARGSSVELGGDKLEGVEAWRAGATSGSRVPEVCGRVVPRRCGEALEGLESLFFTKVWC